jgi:UDP-N-acetylglucosamine 2-epimerase (non-hydrolysing)
MLDLICGARPNFMKVDPVLRALNGSIPSRLVHTGQHYDHSMSASFFSQLGLPEPDLNLEVGSHTVTVQTARVMERYERALEPGDTGAVLVVGDVNSTLACALVAVRYGIPVVHVEAGLRSFDRGMPEEVNRVLTDQIADLLLITSPEARDNLLAEGRPEPSIVMVGNPMIDTLLRLLPEAEKRGAEPPREPYGMITLHRPSNVDSPARLSAILQALGRIDGYRLLLPAHPRTEKSIARWGLADQLPDNLEVCPPMDYLSFLRHQRHAGFVVTDSGGIQEETSVLGVPCVTVRPNTERPVTVEMGTNVLCPEPGEIPAAVGRRVAEVTGPADIPMWDGGAGARIAEAVKRLVGSE